MAMAATVIATLALGVAATACPQAPAEAGGGHERELERFGALRSMQKAMVVARTRNRLARAGLPAFDRIRALWLDANELPEATPAPVFEAARWAPSQPERKPHPQDSDTYREAAEQFARAPFLPELHARVRYDWCRGEIVAEEVPLDYAHVFENLLNGFPPGTDQAIAQVLATLDDPAMREIAHWFGHTYVDLQGGSFPGITLYDAWYSGRAVLVPDVDAVPFAHVVLGKTEMKSPLSGEPRNRLYEAIKKSALRYRKHRTMLEAAAASFVSVEPNMDETYARLVPRFHVMLPECDDSLEDLAKKLRAEDRDAWIEAIDRRVSDPDAPSWETRLSREAELRAMAEACRTIALEELGAFDGKQVADLLYSRLPASPFLAGVP